MGRGTQQQDLFLQFKTFTITAGADATTLAETEVDTGLSIRGEFGWLIHFVEVGFYGFHAVAADNVLQFGLSIQTGLAAMPAITDKGCISRINLGILYQTSGVAYQRMPMRDPFLPPVIIASPRISGYYAAVVNDAALQNGTQWVRIGYTTIPIDQKMYLEIAETFEQV